MCNSSEIGGPSIIKDTLLSRNGSKGGPLTLRPSTPIGGDCSRRHNKEKKIGELPHIDETGGSRGANLQERCVVGGVDEIHVVSSPGGQVDANVQDTVGCGLNGESADRAGQELGAKGHG